MNNDRRGKCNEVIQDLEGIHDKVEGLYYTEQEAYENLPDGIRDGDRGERMEEVIDSLYDAMDDIDSAMESLREAIA